MNNTPIGKAFNQWFFHTFLRATGTGGGADTTRAALGKNLLRHRAPSIVRANTRLDAEYSALALPMIIATLQTFAPISESENQSHKRDKPDQHPNSLEVKNSKDRKSVV